jgi:hypothetical protein
LEEDSSFVSGFAPSRETEEFEDGLKMSVNNILTGEMGSDDYQEREDYQEMEDCQDEKTDNPLENQREDQSYDESGEQDEGLQEKEKLKDSYLRKDNSGEIEQSEAILGEVKSEISKSIEQASNKAVMGKAEQTSNEITEEQSGNEIPEEMNLKEENSDEENSDWGNLNEENLEEEDGKLRDIANEFQINPDHIFGDFLKTASIKKQLAKSLENILGKDTKTVLMIITGSDNADKINLAKDIALFMNEVGKLKSSKVAKITAEKLNKVDIIAKKDTLKDCCLVIEDAGELNITTVDKLLELIKLLKEDIAIIFETDNRNLSKLFRESPVLINLLHNRIYLSQ